jgi:hypothetical protein
VVKTGWWWGTGRGGGMLSFEKKYFNDENAEYLLFVI